MKKILLLSFFVISGIWYLPSCKTEKESTQGGLFIIGGGERADSLMDSLCRLALLKPTDYIAVLTMASEEPDTSAFYIKKQFSRIGFANCVHWNFAKNAATNAQIDSLKLAKLIYVTGGDQNRFMQSVLNTPVYDALLYANNHGAVIAGTSAGAAIMSERMITGNELKNNTYTGNYRTIESKNIEIKQGMGFVKTLIIDQHFIWRMRMNRLIATAIENPEHLAVGIDESTAIWVKNKVAKVYGKSQVIVLKNSKKSSREQKGLLGVSNMNLSVYLPGESFDISN